MNDVATWAGNLVALVALVISLYTWVTSTRGARNDVLAQVRDWGADVVNLLADARALCIQRSNSSGDVFSREVTGLRARTSALLDRGRFFFPNLGGIRPPILDLLMIAYELLPGITEEEDSGRRKQAFHYLQVVFVSTLRQAVNFSKAPSSVKKYETHLAKLAMEPLPGEILELMAENHSFELVFDERTLDELPKRDPAPE